MLWPNTRHYVLTTHHSMVYGRHFYSSTIMLESCYKLVHSLLCDKLITNSSLLSVHHLLPGIRELWKKGYKIQSPTYLTGKLIFTPIATPKKDCGRISVFHMPCWTCCQDTMSWQQVTAWFCRRHFYSSTVMLESCYGLVHSLLCHKLITNSSSPSVYHLLPGILELWKKGYEVRSPTWAHLSCSWTLMSHSF